MLTSVIGTDLAESVAQKKEFAMSLSLECFDAFTAGFIRSKVGQLSRRAGFTEADYEDLVQEVVLYLLKYCKHFDPHRGPWEAFVVMTCRQCLSKFLASRRAEMRSPEREEGSLDRPLQDGDGGRGAMISGTESGKRTGCYPRDDQETFELGQDVANVLASLPARSREVCERLMRGESKASIARDMGMSRVTLRRILRELQQRFARAGLWDYLA